MLATITVTKLADDTTVDAQVTLREAILAANTDTSVDGSSAGDGADTISFAQNLFGSPRTITLALGELPITEALTITGPGQDVLTIDAQQQSRILNVFPGIATGDFDVTVDGLTLTGGRTTGSNQIINGILESTHSGGAIRFDSLGTLALINSTISKSSTAGDFALGGGIRSLGALELTNSTISGNSTKGSNATGGGVHTVGPLSITNSTISANSTAGNFAGGGGVLALDSVALTNSAVTGNGTGGNSSVGGGIFSIGGAFTLINSTISENRTAGNGAFGGGVATTVPLVSTNSTISGNSTTGESSDGGGVSANSSVTLINSTVSGNKTEGDFADGGGVVMFDNAALRISNSIIAGNTVAFGNVGPDFLPEQTPIIPALTLSVTNSLIGDNSGTSLNAAPVGSPDTDGNLIGTSVSPINPLLGPLGNNGGPTQTHALLPGSPAIDAGNSTIARDAGLDYDQRGIGFERTVDGDNDGMMIVDMGAFEFSVDFGDAPAPYLTTFAEDGARHVAIGPTLGTTRDTEAGGTHSANADHDDTNGDSDEDGVTFGTIRVGQLDATATVNVQGGSARLDAWIDFNQDGSWGGAWEQIADNVLVQTGDNTIEFDVPSWAVSGTTYARFRLSTAGNLGVGGEAADGEVEDYTLSIATPTATEGLFRGETIVGSTARSPSSVFAADIDGDGDIDLLSASESDDRIAWYENDGHQQFIARSISEVADFALSVFAADMDGDGDIDVLSASWNDSKIAWYENDGTQQFTEHPISTVANLASSVSAVDLDQDGDMDVLSSQGWYKNDGSQNFTHHTISSVANFASIFATDLDKDGDIDVLSARAFDDRITWNENDGRQRFTAHNVNTPEENETNGEADSVQAVFAGDMDGDGDI
ncbi:MAG: VCBS repeat-containing protein, partial [Planctomycetes bacterium]|nr:VCBS repeat-containing protein [Planctomycetota bacterium]